MRRFAGSTKRKGYAPLDRTRSITGQVMLLTVLALGGVILGVTTIAGLLMLFQIRQTTDVANSTKAIFAADAGLEWALYESFKVSSANPVMPVPVFTNGASVAVTCYGYDSNNVLRELSSCEKPDPDLASPVNVIRSVGSAGTAHRAFALGL